jgi:hypothetical protein
VIVRFGWSGNIDLQPSYRLAIAWLEVIGKLAIPAATCVGAWLGFLAYVGTRINEKRINGHSDTLQTLLLNTPSPAVSGAAPVSVTVSESATPKPQEISGATPGVSDAEETKDAAS